MPASYVERLIWRFVKERILAGWRLFLVTESLPATLVAVALCTLKFTIGVRLLAPALVLLVVGVVLYHRTISVSLSAVLSAVCVGVLLVSAPLTPIEPTLLNAIAISALLGWFTFNAAVFLLQATEFFASTAGLYLLLGSDRERIFLSPLPQLICVSGLLAGLLLLAEDPTRSALLTLAFSLTLAAMYTPGRLRNRIVRASLSVFSLLLLYALFVTLTGAGLVQGAVTWGVLGVLSTLFTVQSHALRAAERRRGDSVQLRATGSVYAMLGIVLLVLDFALSHSTCSSLSWWDLSLASFALAIPVFLSYITASGRLNYYVQRDSTPLLALVRETISALGRFVLDELKRALPGLVADFVVSLLGLDSSGSHAQE